MVQQSPMTEGDMAADVWEVDDSKAMTKVSFFHRRGKNKMSLNMRIKNDLEFQIGKYQSRATCFDIILTEA